MFIAPAGIACRGCAAAVRTNARGRQRGAGKIFQTHGVKAPEVNVRCPRVRRRTVVEGAVCSPGEAYLTNTADDLPANASSSCQARDATGWMQAEGQRRETEHFVTSCGRRRLELAGAERRCRTR